MLKGKEHALHLAEAQGLLSELRGSGQQCPYWVFYLHHGSIGVGGLFQDEDKRNPFGPKRFEMRQENGGGIEIPDVVDARLLFRHPEGYYDTYSTSCILEPSEAGDVFVFAIRAKAEYRHDPDYYRMLQPTTLIPQRDMGQGRVDIETDGGRFAATELFACAVYELVTKARRVLPEFGQEMLAEHYDCDGTPKLGANGRSTMLRAAAIEWLSNAEKIIELGCEYRPLDAEIFQLALFHNQELVCEIEDVFRLFRVGRNVQAVYVKPNPAYEGSYGELSRMSDGERAGEPPYAYWLYSNSESSMIGTGWTMDPGSVSTPRLAAIRGIGAQQTADAPGMASERGSVIVRYHFEATPMFEMLHQYATEHGEVSLCEHLFSDDTTRNHSVKLSTDDQDSIAFVDFIFSHAPSLAGEQLYWADLDDYYVGTKCLDTELRLMNAAPKTRDTHRQLLRLLYEKCGEPFDETRLPAKVSAGVEGGGRQTETLRRYVESEHPILALLKDGRLIDGSDGPIAERVGAYLSARSTEFDKRRNQAFDGGGASRWKVERTLFEMVRSYYDDAVYQFRAGWLGQQSVDVFIPSLRVALEYQGKQHYKSVDYFGGDSALQDAQRRDSLKRRACEAEGVRLLEWPYWTPLSALTVFQMLGRPR